MWTAENRPRYNRDKLRYPSDLTDEEWAHIEPLIPPAKPGGGKRRVKMREVADGVMYVLSTGCQWRSLPKDLPPRSTVHDYLSLWTWDGTLDCIHHALYVNRQGNGTPYRHAKGTPLERRCRLVPVANRRGPCAPWSASHERRNGVAREVACLPTWGKLMGPVRPGS